MFIPPFFYFPILNGEIDMKGQNIFIFAYGN
jgi:hypothetical protein